MLFSSCWLFLPIEVQTNRGLQPENLTRALAGKLQGSTIDADQLMAFR
jgi:hypothetical protein